MAELPPAAAALRRILWLLPAASRQGGIDLEEAALTLDVTRARVLKDVEEVTAREYYLPSDAGARLQISLEGDRLHVWSAGVFSRPTRLTARELLPLGLALRARAAATADDGERRDLRALALRLEEALGAASPDELLPRFALDADSIPGSDRLRRLLMEAIEARRLVEMEYLKPAASAPERRAVEPYEVMRSPEGWYLLGHCRRSEGIRAFRLDRVISAAMTEANFDLPVDFDADEHLTDGRLYRSEEDEIVTVRYSGSAARWVREEAPPGEVEEDGGGDIVVRHRVSDPEWIVRRVLSFAPAAEVLEPEEVRRRVGEAAVRIAIS